MINKIKYWIEEKWEIHKEKKYLWENIDEIQKEYDLKTTDLQEALNKAINDGKVQSELLCKANDYVGELKAEIKQLKTDVECLMIEIESYRK